jgi:hypothetical protein
MKTKHTWLAALVCAAVSSGALAASSSVTFGGVSYGLKDLDPNDGITPEIAFAPTFDYYSEQQQYDLVNGSAFDFYSMFRCPCPIIVGNATTRLDDGGISGRTLGPDSTYVDQAGRGPAGFYGVTPGTEVTVRVAATFFADAGASAGLEVQLVGYSLFPDRYDPQRSIGNSSWADGADGLAEASFVNTGERLAPFHFAYRMDISGTSPPIPEPETWALLAIGLGTVGWQARRRITRR